MTLLNIFNNESYLWIAFILLVVWVAIWGYRTYKGYKSGYQTVDKYGKATDVPKSWKNLFKDGNFIFLVLGTIGIIAFILWVNSDYK